MGTTTPTNIAQVSNSILMKAFDATKEEDFLNTSMYPRYSDPTYLKIIPVNLEDNPEIENVQVELKSFVFAPIPLDFATDDLTGVTRILHYDFTEVPTTKTYKAVRKFASSMTTNPIRVIQNIIDLNKSFDIAIELLVKYTQTFKIPAGQTKSNVFEILNQNTEYDKNFYVNLSPDTVTNIGNQANYNALQMRNYRSTYNNLGNNVEVDKWFIGIANPVSYDIIGTSTTYTSIIIPRNTQHFILPTMRTNEIEDYSNSFSIVDINTGRFNIVEFKSEPLVSGTKCYDRLVLFMDNKNISGQEINFKIQNMKNFLIPKGEVQAHYTYGIVNTLPGVVNSSPVTSIGSFNPYDYTTTIVNMNQFPPAPELTPTEIATYTGYVDSNVITDPSHFHIYTDHVETFINTSSTSVDYIVNIAEFNSIVNIYEGTTLLGQGIIDSTGGFSTKLFNPLSDGTHVLYFKVLDRHGNESYPSQNFMFTVDTVSPVPPIISSYYILDDTNINPFETIPDLNKFQMYGTTNNANPYIVGFIKEQAKVNIYLNNVLVGQGINTYPNSLMNESRNDNTFGFSYRLPHLQLGSNSITYEIVDTAGNVSVMSQAAFIIYETAAANTPTIYTIDSIGHQIEITSSSIITDDASLTFYGNGCRNKTLAKVYEVTGTAPNEIETLIAEAVVKKNTFSFNKQLSIGNHTLRFKVKSNDTGLEVVIDRTISIVGDRPTSIITIEDIPNENRYKKVTFTFSEAIFGFTPEDVLTQKCTLLKETKFGIDPLQTTDNIVFEGIIFLVENYSSVYNDGYIKLKDSSVYSTNGIYNMESSLTGINNPVIPLVDVTDYNVPFTPVITLTIIDTRFGNRILTNGDVIDDNYPTISGTNIGAYSEDTIFAVPLTRSFKLPAGANYYTEVINASAFDKYRSTILEIQTPYDPTNYKQSFCYLSKTCNYFDLQFFKDTNGFVFPEYDQAGVLYYRTISITKTPGLNVGDAPSYSTTINTIPADNFTANPKLRDILVNRFSGSSINGEYNLTSNASQDPVVTYQVITNDESNFNRKSIINVERYLIIFANSNTVTLNMKIDNPLGIESLPQKYYDENFTLDYNPAQDLIVRNAIFPNYETFEVVNTLVGDQFVKYTKVNHTDTTTGYYKFELVNSSGGTIPATEPVIIKLNLFYNDIITSQQKIGKELRVPIKPYQILDNSNLMYFSWLDFSILNTGITIQDGKINYTISRNKNGVSYKIDFYSIKKVKFRPYNLVTESANSNPYSYSILNEYNLNYSDTAYCTGVELINENGVPFTNMFIINNDSNNQMIRIYPAHPDRPELYQQFQNIELTIKVYFEMTLNGTSTTFSHDFITNDYFNDQKFFKILSIKHTDGSEIQDINFVKCEYTPDVYFDSVRQNPYDLQNNMQTSYNEIEDIKTFDNYYNNITDNFTKVYPVMNSFNFRGNAQFQNDVVIDLDYGPDLVPDVYVNKEQTYVKDLAYYGLEKNCSIEWDNVNSLFKVKATGPIYLNDMNFVDDDNTSTSTVFDVYKTDSEVESRLENRPPRYIWVHTETPNSNISTEINNMTRSEWLGTDNLYYTDPIGRYVPWVWEDIADSDFWINGNQLDSLVTALGYNLPKTIKGSFRCNNNNLVNLIGGPSDSVYGSYVAKNNKLSSLEGLPLIIGGEANIYYTPGDPQWNGVVDTSWAKQQTLFDDTDFSSWNNSILETPKLGSSLDLSFNTGINNACITNMNLTNPIIVGWNIYLAGTGITYTDIDLDLIRTKFITAGIIYTVFDQTNYCYKIKLDTDPVVNSNTTQFNTSNFYSSLNKFDRTLNIGAEYSQDIKTVSGGTSSYTPLYDKVKLTASTNFVSSKTYHNTSEEIV